ncbi:MAG TPA: hypothetical protein VG226_09660 [Acidimicrobiales bacterium]|jgi:uncharacterized membrane protein|nr:hypothetical protein [Acidimicrobiales bacterium]
MRTSPDDLAVASAPPAALIDEDPVGTGVVIERCAWSVVWLSVLTGGINLWGWWPSWPAAPVVGPAFVLLGIVGLAWTWLVRRPRSLVYQLAAMGSILASMAIPQAIAIHIRQYYSTDSGAFNQVAARVLVHGQNPYQASMASAAQLLKNPQLFWTYIVNGTHVTHVSYPAGSFLFEVPALWFGFHHQVSDWMDLYAWIVTGILLFVIMPAALRWLAALIAVTPIFVGVFSSGGTDALFVPFLVLAVWRWDRFGAGRQAGMARWLGPIALGMACAIKQTPWFCVPFLVLGVVLEARRTGRPPLRLAGLYVGIVALVFAAVNLPFFIWQPSAWVRGNLIPFRQPLVADGQGLVSLALHGITGGVNLSMLTLASALAYVALLIAMVIWFPAMKRVWLFLLPIVFFVAARSLTSYLVDFFPAAVVAAVTVTAVTTRAKTITAVRLRIALMATTAAAAVAGIVVASLAFVSPPLQLAVRAVRTSNQATTLNSVTVTVDNRTANSVTPHFMVIIGSGHPAGYWSPAGHRPVVLPPHGAATVTLYPPLFTEAPNHGDHWVVAAYTSKPGALSTSPLQFWKLGKQK